MTIQQTNTQKITPFLWFDDQAEEAARFYTSLFPNSRICHIERYPAGAPLPEGTVMTVAFTLDGLSFMALNAGPHFKFTEAISFVVTCESQQEIDTYWEGLSAGGGEKSRCGWLKDRYGLSWQITPSLVGTLLQQGDPKKSTRMMHALWQMDKLDIEALHRAYEGQDKPQLHSDPA